MSRPEVKTELIEVVYQVGFFLEPVYHSNFVEVPITKGRKGNNKKKKK